MRHLLALDLQLKFGLLLGADVDGHTDQLEKIPMFIRETAAADDDPAGPAMRQNEAVFGFEGSMRRARAIESRVDRGPFIRMDARRRSSRA